MRSPGSMASSVDLLQRAVAVANRGTWHAGEQSGHLAAGAALGEALEILSAGIHERHHRGREVLGEYERGRHRQRRGDVQSDVAPAQAERDVGAEDGQHRERGRRPDRPGPLRPAGGGGQQAGHEQRRRPRHEDRAEPGLEPDDRGRLLRHRINHPSGGLRDPSLNSSWASMARNRARATARNVAPRSVRTMSCGHTTSMPAAR